jgi:hypothetical protein
MMAYIVLPVCGATLGEYVWIDVEISGEGGEVSHAGPHLRKIVTQRAKAKSNGNGKLE